MLCSAPAGWTSHSAQKGAPVLLYVYPPSSEKTFGERLTGSFSLRLKYPPVRAYRRKGDLPAILKEFNNPDVVSFIE
jgi:hypothetical protein